MKRETLGFIGLGIMGRPMALNLAKAGFPLVVHNRTAARAEALASEQIRPVGSPAEVARAADVVITMVTDSAAVEEVVRGSQGILGAARPGSLVVDMSTISPAVEQQLDEVLRRAGAGLVDAPVSGGDVGAQKGTLAIMAGGREEDFDRLLPIFQAMGKTITHCGPVGAGQLTKLCNQILVSVTLLGVSEALNFARRNGLKLDTVIGAVEGGAAGSWQLSNLGPRIARQDWEPGFMIDLMQKDLRLVHEAASRSGVSVPAAALVHQLFNGAQSQGMGRKGTQALARIVAGLSG